MTEYYISFEQSVKLKELGFAEKVNHTYLKKIRIEPEVSVGDLKEIHSKDPKNYNDNRKGAEKGLIFYSAPRLDQAQAWLREVRGIHILLNPYSFSPDRYDGDNYFWSFELFQAPSGGWLRANGGGFDTYEQALSAGIDKSLEIMGRR